MSIVLLLGACAQATGTAGSEASPRPEDARTPAIVRDIPTPAPASNTPAASVSQPPAVPSPARPNRASGDGGCVAADEAIIRTQDGTEHRLQLEVARTAAERSVGLMGREALAEDAGMLFVFETVHRPTFWMRNTLIPLSIAFLSTDGTIVDIQDMQPLDETFHVSAAPALYGLEVNQGYFAQRGIGVGDQIELRLNSRSEAGCG